MLTDFALRAWSPVAAQSSAEEFSQQLLPTALRMTMLDQLWGPRVNSLLVAWHVMTTGSDFGRKKYQEIKIQKSMADIQEASACCKRCVLSIHGGSDGINLLKLQPAVIVFPKHQTARCSYKISRVNGDNCLRILDSPRGWKRSDRFISSCKRAP